MQQSTNSCNRKISVPGNPLWNTRFKSCVFADDIAEELCGKFRDAELLLQNSTIIKNSRSTTAGIFHLHGIDYFIKRSNVNSFFERVKRIGRTPRALRSYHISAFLEKLGVRVPRVFMAMTTLPGGLPGASYLITEAFPQPMTVSNNLPRLLEFYGSCEKTAQAIADLAHKVHDAGLEHGDFKLNNILFADHADNSFELGLFDFDGTILHRTSCSYKVRCRELARIASSYFLRGCDLAFCTGKDAGENARMWAKAYARGGKFDFAGDKTYMRRYEDFLKAGKKKV